MTAASSTGRAVAGDRHRELVASRRCILHRAGLRLVRPPAAVRRGGRYLRYAVAFDRAIRRAPRRGQGLPGPHVVHRSCKAFDEVDLHPPTHLTWHLGLVGTASPAGEGGADDAWSRRLRRRLAGWGRAICR